MEDLKEIIILTDAEVDVKDCRRAMLDYFKANNIKFGFVNARE